MDRPVDIALLAGAALVAGALRVVAPCEVAAAAVALLARASRWRRGGCASAVAVVVAASVLGAGAAPRARRGLAARGGAGRGRRRARPAARCTARARVVSSPVRARGVLRWDARLDEVACDGDAVAWRGRATLYGGPDDLARGDEAEVVATLGAPQRLWNAATGDPRPGEAHRGVAALGGDARRRS